ncbi:MAG: GNAT family N-acetyltransferase, partial [Alphaproteobacteria bacterium]|nr:GNAT family N-acetyltransferase [Alphaproteobacteria bacterium]
MALTIQSFSGSDAAPFFGDLARLRSTVFRAFPYLYEGNPDYEQTYLSTYAKSEGSVFVLAIDGDEVVGVATGTPMAGETEEVKRPFLEVGLDPQEFFYFGESVLLPEYRGQGIGVKFFEGRETQAKKLG